MTDAFCGWRTGLIIILLLGSGLLRAEEVAADRGGDTETPPSATDVVESFHGALAASLASGESFEGRFAMLEGATLQAYHVPSIARISVGGHWKTLGMDQRQQLVELLSRLIVTTYAARFDENTGQVFVTRGAESPRPGRAVVRTTLELKNRDDVNLDYLLRDVDGVPRIYNVSADGVSDLSLRRAEYSAILGDAGFDGLVEALEGNIQGFIADADD